MKLRLTLLLAVAFVSGGFLFLVMAPAQPVVGRYAVSVVSPSGYQYIFVTDTATGQTWRRSLDTNNEKWESYGSPINPK